MKKRIIAALTALVMVVTMIPANAFAAYEYTADDVSNLILAATTEGSVNNKLDVPYTEDAKAAIDKAKAEYAKLSPADKEKVNSEATKYSTYSHLLAAEAVYNYYGATVAEYEVALTALKPGTLVSDGTKLIVAGDKVINPVLNNIKVAGEKIKAVDTKVFAQDGKVFIGKDDKKPAEFTNGALTCDTLAANLALAETAKLTQSAKDLKKVVEALVGSDYADTVSDVAKSVKAINDITSKVVNDITEDVAVGSTSKAARDLVDKATTAVETLANNAVYAKNYDLYLAAKEKIAGIDMPTDVATELDAAKTSLDDYITKFVVTGSAAAVKESNIKKARIAVENAEIAYNKYATKYPKSDKITGLAEAIKAAKENIALYEKALALKEKVDEFTKIAAGDNFIKFTEAQMKEILALDSKNEFTNTAKLDKIDLFFDNAGVKTAYDSLVAIVNGSITLNGPEVIAQNFAKKFNEINAQIPMVNVSIKYRDKIQAAIDVLNEYIDIAKANASVFAKVDLGEGSKIDRFADVANINTDKDVYIFAKADENNDVKKVITVADFKAFQNKVAVVVAAKTKATNVVKNLDDVVKADSKGNMVVDDSKSLADLKAAIKAFDDAVAKFTVAEKAALEAIDDKRTEDTVKYNTTAEMIVIINKAITEMTAVDNALKDPAAAHYAKEIQTIINTEIELLSDPGELTDADVARNAKAFAKIEELLKIANVELYFRGLNAAGTDINVNYPEVLPEAEKGKYKFGAEIIRYQTALSEATPEKPIPTDVQTVIDAIKALKLDADLNNNIKAFNDVYALYNGLSNNDKALVSNIGELRVFANTVTNTLVKGINEKAATLGKVSADATLTTDQLVVVAEINGLIKPNKDILEFVGAYDSKADIGVDAANWKNMYKAPFADAMKDYALATILVKNIDEINATKNEIAPIYKEFVKGVKTESDIKTVTDFKAVLNTIDAFNSLSKTAQDVLLKNDTATGKFSTEQSEYFAVIKKALDDANLTDDFVIETLREVISKEAKYKSVVLDYAKVEPIEDQVFAGEPVVVPADKIVVKDFAGNVIPADKYTVEFAQNEKVGVAEVIIKAKDGSNLIGMAKGTFNIVEGEKVPAPTNLEVIGTDNGVLKVGVDAIEGVEGLTYKFFVRKIGNKNWVAKETKENVATFTGLTKNGEYDVKAVAIVNGEESEAVVKVGTVYANRIGTRSALMYKPVIKKVTIKNGVAKVTVKEFNYNNIKYSLGFKKAGAKEYKWLQYTTRTVKTVKNLKKGTKYTFKVKYQYTSEVSGTTIKSVKWSNGVTKVAR